MKHTDAIMSETLGNSFFFAYLALLLRRSSYQEDASVRSGANVLVLLVSFWSVATFDSNSG